MHNAPCSEEKCPMMILKMDYCCNGSETDPPCIDMTNDELWTLRNEIEEKYHDKGE